MQIGNEVILFLDIAVQPVIRPHPQAALAIDKQRPDITVAQAVGFAAFLHVDFELVAIIAVEPGFRTDPDKPLPILGDGENGALGEARFQRNSFASQTILSRE